jgi:uncharacterized protein (TIGR02466 family)
MSIQYYFPTAILSELHENVAKDLLPIAKQYLNDPKFVNEQWGYKSTFTNAKGIAEEESFKPFINFIHRISRDYLVKLGYDESKIGFDTQLWVAEMTAGDEHRRHTHANSILSGILYLEIPKDSAPIVFTDPRPFREIIALPKLGDVPTNWENVIFKPENGLLLLWESWLAHEVPKTRNEGKRTTIVFNLTNRVYE